MRPSRSVPALAAALAVVLVAPVGAAAVEAPTPPEVVVAPVTAGEITFTGHGWGHGRGMGQYGALGYAVDRGWSYQQILDHYYGGTTMGTAPDTPIDVELVAKTNSPVVVAGNALRVNGSDIPGAGLDVVLVEKTAGGYSVKRGSSCGTAAPGTLVGVYPSVELTVPSQATEDDLIRICEAENVMRAYRGSVIVRNHTVTTQQVTFNRTSVENYLRGVVPRESPASWGSLGAGKGMEALKAQAVAARSYALASTRPSGATTCDTISCQVYGGAALYRWNGSAYVRSTAAADILEQPNTNAAVSETAGQVRVKAGTTAIARTEFSSSTGGWTSGGVFPAVEDLGDSISKNPNHTWAVTISAADLARKLGLPSGVDVASIAVTGRNGLGDLGGRVTELTWVGTNGVTYRKGANGDADAIRSLLGLKSNWFAISGTTISTARSVVTALYHDLLGRGPDPTGLATWTDALLTGTSQAVLVSTLTRSDEYISSRVTKAYREVLGREPEPAGAASWLQQIRAGNATVDDVQRRFYDSLEYYVISGGTVDGYVRRLYQTVLLRPATDADVAFWSAGYAERGRGYVVDSIWFSKEAAMIRAGAYYQTFLGRGPDPTGLELWSTVLLTQGEGAVRNGIAGSLEYRDRAVARFP